MEQAPSRHPPLPNPVPAAFVLVGHDQAIVGFSNESVSFGFLHGQTGLAPPTNTGTYIAGTQFVANGSVPNLAGIITPMGKTLSGTLDAEQILLPPPDPVQVSGAAITGKYVFDSPATGRGTGQSTTPGPSNFILYNVSDFEVILLESDSKSSQPVLVDLRQDPGSPFDY
jgi:hypothetical protein